MIDVKAGELLKDIAKQWREMNEEEKKEYMESAEKANINHLPKRSIPSSAFGLYVKESRQSILKQHQGWN